MKLARRWGRRFGCWISGGLLAVGAGLLPGAVVGAGSGAGCGGDLMTRALAKCGTNVRCMNAFMASERARCARKAGPAKSPALPGKGMPGKGSGPGGLSLREQLARCGYDIACMNRVAAGARAAMPPRSSTPPPPPPGRAASPVVSGGAGTAGVLGGGTGESQTKFLEALRQCEGDEACREALGQKAMAETLRKAQGRAAPARAGTVPGLGGSEGTGRSGGDATWRIGEGETVFLKSWLQQYQNRIVECGNDVKDVPCRLRERKAGQGMLPGLCGPIGGLDPGPGVCRGVGMNELAIEEALADQRLHAGERTHRAEPPASAGGGASLHRESRPGAGAAAPGARPGWRAAAVAPPELRALLAHWTGKIESATPPAARERIQREVSKLPRRPVAGAPPLAYRQSPAAGKGDPLEIHPASQEWAFALNGTLLTMAGFLAEAQSGSGKSAGAGQGRVLLDLGFWCFLKAAVLASRPEHLANVGFHLNLRGALTDAETVLRQANAAGARSPDAHNNLAFTLAALGRPSEARGEQKTAYRQDPGDPHISSALRHTALPGPGASGSAAASREAVPAGFDFGEAFFRLGKRQLIREYRLGRAWQKAVHRVQGRVFGGLPPVAGPYQLWQERLRDIARDHETCIDSAPPALSGCPFGDFIVHPACRNAPSREEVAYSRRAHDAAVCQCDAVAAERTADAITAYIDRALDVERDFERTWRPRLHRHAREWIRDIDQVNARYRSRTFVFPVGGNVLNWIVSFEEDSRQFWNEDYPRLLSEERDLRDRAVSRAPCAKVGRPPAHGPRHPPGKGKRAPRAHKSLVINLIVVNLAVRDDLSGRIEVDLGFVKGAYEILPGNKGWAVEAGTGPVGVRYAQGDRSANAGDDYRVEVTVGLKASTFVPGTLKPLAGAADEVLSVGAKFGMAWGSRTGFRGKVSTEAQPKFAIETRTSPLPAYTRLQI